MIIRISKLLLDLQYQTVITRVEIEKEDNTVSEESQQLDNSVIAQLQNEDHSSLAQQLDELTCEHSDIVELLAQYQVLSEQDDDEKFDSWYDGLCEDKLRVLKGFEIFRAHFERLVSAENGEVN